MLQVSALCGKVHMPRGRGGNGRGNGGTDLREFLSDGTGLREFLRRVCIKRVHYFWGNLRADRSQAFGQALPPKSIFTQMEPLPQQAIADRPLTVWQKSKQMSKATLLRRWYSIQVAFDSSRRSRHPITSILDHHRGPQPSRRMITAPPARGQYALLGTRR